MVQEKGPRRFRVGPLQRNNPGSDLLSHTPYACSTIGGSRLNFRVRNGNGCDPAPMTTGKLASRHRASCDASRQSQVAIDTGTKSCADRAAGIPGWSASNWGAAYLRPLHALRRNFKERPLFRGRTETN